MGKCTLIIFFFLTLFGIFYDSKAARINTLNEHSNDTESTNKTTTTRQIFKPKSGGINCYQCTSWKNAGCGVKLYRSLASYYNIPVGYCYDSCIKIVVDYSGKTEVIRGCTTDTKLKDTLECTESFCNNGTKVKAILKSLFISILCSLFFLL